MFLKELLIHNEKHLIRRIPFHKGINLIIDETPLGNSKVSGNSVGKTTVLRLIDYCLAGKGKNIYVDPEFKNTNNIIEEFLTENNILITLKLVPNLDYPNRDEIVIEKNFLARREKIQSINGEKYKSTGKDFDNKLKELIFKTTVEFPSFKQLKSKNIRDEKYKLVNTIKVLAPNVVTNATYEMLHLFWMGIPLDANKDQLVREKNLEEKIQERLKAGYSYSTVKQSLVIINNQIDKFTKLKENFNLDERYEEKLVSLNSIKSEINSISANISRLSMRRDLISESMSLLESELSDVDASQIKFLYDSAKTYIPAIQKSFEETLDFHNKMVEQKKNFISEELPLLEDQILASRRELQSLLSRETELSNHLSKSGAVEELQAIIDKLNDLYEKKGKLEEQQVLWERTVAKLDTIESQLGVINQNLKEKNELVQTRIEAFNTFFSDISSRLGGEHSLLVADHDEGTYKFSITNIEGNPGTGKKKSQMAAFDLAYIQFADAFNIPCLHFILQDQIENVHSNQISHLLNSVVNEVNCQYVLPVLRDKLPSDIDVESLKIISLSQDDKLFRV